MAWYEEDGLKVHPYGVDSFDIIEVGGFCPPTSLINVTNLYDNYTLFRLFVKANGALGTIGADAPIYPLPFFVIARSVSDVAISVDRQLDCHASLAMTGKKERNDRKKHM